MGRSGSRILTGRAITFAFISALEILTFFPVSRAPSLGVRRLRFSLLSCLGKSERYLGEGEEMRAAEASRRTAEEESSTSPRSRHLCGSDSEMKKFISGSHRTSSRSFPAMVRSGRGEPSGDNLYLEKRIPLTLF